MESRKSSLARGLMISMSNLENNMMAVTALERTLAGAEREPLFPPPLKVEALESRHEREVLAFLSARPTHTIFLTGLIGDNGLVSHLNRGTFYGCRDSEGRLEGAALIGHLTVVETESQAALAAFAKVAQTYSSAHLILGEKQKVQAFWQYFVKSGRTPRIMHSELLLERDRPNQSFESISGLRQATPNDLPRVAPVNARMVFEESGVNPMERDPEGFQQRLLRRINQGRVWLWTENGRLIFSANVSSRSDEVSYLEGVYVNPNERGKGYGLRCLSQLTNHLLQNTKSICLLVNEQNNGAREFYRKAAYTVCGLYDTIFLHLKN